MLLEDIESKKEILDEEQYNIPSYITDNLRYPLYEWQRKALENFLVNEITREKKKSKGEKQNPNHLMFNMATGSGKTLVMAALILYYYKQGFRNFIFFVNQNAILGKTQANFINSSHNKYLFKENIVIDGKRICIREVDVFSNSSDDIQIKFTTIQKLHNDIYKESENALLLSDLQKRDLILIGDEAHHLNASTAKKKKEQTEIETPSFIGELKDSAKDDDIEKSWETTICNYILGKKGKDGVSYAAEQNRNALLEFTATIPRNDLIQEKYEDKIITKFELKDFVEAKCTKHIRLVRSNLEQKERVLQALLLNWYRYRIGVDYGIPNFKPVILFRSKEIENSKADYQWFLDLCKNVKGADFGFVKKLSKIKNDSDDQADKTYSFDGRIFERIRLYMEEREISFENVVAYIRESFQERNIVITNSKTNKTQKEKTDGEIDYLLNSLEDRSNHIRAIFTVQRLTEGWDVLNLYDIVRLYTGRDTDYKNKKVGSHTTSEVQLIGRGVRYYPFAYKDKEKSRRKFDDELQNELRILEEFYFHSEDEEKYISDLSNELKNRGLMQDKRTQKTFNVKEKYQSLLNGMYFFVNEKKENPNRRLKTLPKDFKNLPAFEWNMKGLYSEVQAVNLSQKEDTLYISDSAPTKTKAITFAEIPRHVKYKAIHRLNANSSSYFNYENICKRFDVDSMDDFLEFVKNVKICISSPMKFENIPNAELLKMCERFMLNLQRELESYDKPYIGSDFKLVKFSDVFSFDDEKGKIGFKKEKMILIDDGNDDAKENKRLEKELKNEDWYMLDSFWGTEEERKLIEFIKSRKSNLEDKYKSFQLLRNEEVYKIFDFETGQGFQPDFLLLLQGKNGNNNAYYQVFVEPKGKHLAGEENDGWKEKFLLEISKRYGLNNIVVEKSKEYILIGLPFFNDTNKEMRVRFETEFVNSLKVSC
ncbi:DEAD/DEAH box helicase family protein [Fibrobacter sp.]